MLTLIVLGSLLLIALAAAKLRWSGPLAWTVTGIVAGAVVFLVTLRQVEKAHGEASVVTAAVKGIVVATLAVVAAALIGVSWRRIVAYGLPAMMLPMIFVADPKEFQVGWARIGFWGLLAAYLIHLALLTERPATVRARTIVWMAIWFALATSLIELGWRVLRLWIFGSMAMIRSTDALCFLPPETYWSTPAANLSVFAAVALSLIVIRWIQPQWVTMRLVAFSFGWTACLAVFFNVMEWLGPVFVAIYAAAMALGLEYRICSSPERFERLVTRTAPLLAVATLLLVLVAPIRERIHEQSTIASLPPASGKKYNVLLVVMDTARRESIGAFQARRDTTPNIDRFAKRGVVFNHATTNASWTLPSHASIFTGRWCHEHGAGFLDPLPNGYPTIAEVLTSNGYETIGFVSNTGCCGLHTGLGRGFVRYLDHPSPLELARLNSLTSKIVLGTPPWYIRPASDLVGQCLDWFDERKPGRPFFAFLNLLDPHFPYRVQDPRFDEFSDLPQDQRRQIRDRWAADPDSYKPNDPVELKLAIDTYDASIKYMDHQIGRLLDHLESAGVLRNTLVILSNDHGEHFNERGLSLHGTSLYRQLIDAPLVVLFPEPLGVAPRHIDDLVGLQSIPKTVVDVLGIGEKGTFPGSSFASLALDPMARTKDNPVVISQLGQAVNIQGQLNSDTILYSVIADGYHYIRSQAGRREEVFDYWKDRADDHDLIGTPEGRRAADQLRTLLERSMESTTSPTSASRIPDIDESAMTHSMSRAMGAPTGPVSGGLPAP